MLFLLLSLLLALCCCGAARAQAQAQAQASGALERQVKAAYLYKFTGFVEWPDGSFTRPDNPLVIGVAGADVLADQLEQTVAGHLANGRAILVRKLRRGDSLAGLHILFIGPMERAPLQEIIAASRGLPLLTVSDSDDAYAQGSMVNFVVVDDKLRFEVALKPVLLSRMKISARLLSAAYKVQTGGL
ncbi:hypothetical protein GJA_553 [Janthinobacterium agaricidamnosum NBRC 102515 = DSM 9628]|uniref:Transmembrane protein n=1 Tax=Janthinobacterium agaricidamnosum NBRC 102515 = DSM 9628 TaxID=1349767 RepID=W0V1J6_9BURK|nr:hypothetical protein GJA_553 [Janthinobacterium agaricidamnosum NBRC 102515 = DSM 9628]